MATGPTDASTPRIASRSPRKTARVAGVFYLALIVFGAFAELFVRAEVVVPGDATATAGNVLASETLFRVGVASDLLAQVAFLMVALVLYLLLEPVDARAAGLMAILVVVSVPITVLNLLNQFAALYVLTGAELGSFDPAQVNELSLFFLDLHSYGYSLNELFFGLWLLPLGYLVYESECFPTTLGLLLMLGTAGHLIELAHVFVLPDLAVITYPGIAIAAVAEFAFVLYLLVRGVRSGNGSHPEAEPRASD